MDEVYGCICGSHEFSIHFKCIKCIKCQEEYQMVDGLVSQEEFNRYIRVRRKMEGLDKQDKGGVTVA